MPDVDRTARPPSSRAGAAPMMGGLDPVHLDRPGRAVAYSRVSTDAQGASGAGLDAQAAEVARLADRNGLRVEAAFRDVASGATRRRRPGLAQALAELEEGDTLIVAKLDRLSRDIRDFMAITGEVTGRGARLVIGDVQVDTSTPAGEMMVTLLATFAQFERRMAQARTREAVAVKRAQGKSVGGRKPGCFLVPADVRARVRDMRGRGMSLRGIANTLNGEGVPAGRGGRWHAESVRIICR